MHTAPSPAHAAPSGVPRLAVVGTGRMGLAIARAISVAHGDVLWGSRAPERAAALAREHGFAARAVDHAAALDADVVIPTLWLSDLRPWLAWARPRLAGRVLVDITNPFNETYDDFTLPWGTSASEVVQQLVPEARVVGAFKNTYWVVFDEPLHDGMPSDVLVTGDDAAAKRALIDALAPLPFRFLDAGPLTNSRTVERMTLLERELARRVGHHPRVSWRLWGGGVPAGLLATSA